MTIVKIVSLSCGQWHQLKRTNPVHGRFIQYLRGQPFTARHGRLYNERRWYLSYEEVKQWVCFGLLCFVCVSFRWSWPGRTHGCGNRHRIWCSRQTAWRELDRWRGLFSSLLYPSHTPPVYPQGSPFPRRASCLRAAGVYSLWKQRNGNSKLLWVGTNELNLLILLIYKWRCCLCVVQIPSQKYHFVNLFVVFRRWTMVLRVWDDIRVSN